MTTMQRVREAVAAKQVGEPFTSREVLRCGTRASVDQALSRLVKAGPLVRVTRGVYVHPEENRFVGKVMPAAEKVARTIAKATGAAIGVHGAEAARRFRLTTQMPTQAVFHTTGPNRRFELGELIVELKHVSARKLALEGAPGEALSALWYLGKAQVTEETIERIREGLTAAEFSTLKAASASMPAWMSGALHRHEMSTHGA